MSIYRTKTHNEDDEEKFTYQFRKFAQIYYATDEFMREIDSPVLAESMHTSFAKDTLAFRLTWDLACRDLMELKWPSDWKQAFKERWFPGWLLKRYPVRYSHTILTEIAGIPRPDGKDYPVRYAVTKREL
jgi:hypothetical protein